MKRIFESNSNFSADQFDFCKFHCFDIDKVIFFDRRYFWIVFSSAMIVLSAIQPPEDVLHKESNVTAFSGGTDFGVGTLYISKK